MKSIRNAVGESTSWNFNGEQISGVYVSLPHRQLEAVLNVSRWEELSFLDQYLVSDEAKQDILTRSKEVINRHDISLYTNYVTCVPILHGTTIEGKNLTLVQNLLTQVNKIWASQKPNDKLYIELTPFYAIEGALVQEQDLKSSSFTLELSNSLRWIQNDDDFKQAQIPGGMLRLEKTVDQSVSRFHFDFDRPVKIRRFLLDYVNSLKTFLMFVTDSNVDTLRISTEINGNEVNIIALGSSDGLESTSSKRASTSQPFTKFSFSSFDFTNQMKNVFEKHPQYTACFHLYNALLRFPSPSEIVNYATATQVVESIYVKTKGAGELDDKVKLLNKELPHILDNVLDLEHNEIEKLIDRLWSYRNKIIHNRDNDSVWDTSKSELGIAFLTLVFEIKVLHLYGFNQGEIKDLISDYRTADIRMLNHKGNRKLLTG